MLTDSRAVMIFRRVSNLSQTNDFIKNTLKLPLLGEDEYSSMHDAGNIVLAHWVQNETALRAPGAESCSVVNFVSYPLIDNPASEVILSPREFSNMAEGVQSAPVLSTLDTDDNGKAMRFVDRSGNYSSLHHQTVTRLTTDARGTKLRFLLENSVNQPVIAIGHKLMVSDVSKSHEFYTKILGLRSLHLTDNDASFDIGTLVLSIQKEPEAGMLDMLKRSGRLVGDWIIFHVEDIRKETATLQDGGISFPQGIEKSASGEMAYFEDLDGHPLVLWQLPDNPLPEQANFYHAIDRIIG